MVETYKYNLSFSGTDTLAFILFPGCNPVVLGSLTTISYSIFRNKKPVINLGRTNINGITRGSRIFAGSMVFTLINQHWVKDVILQDTCRDWIGKFHDLKVDELPLFDIMIISANEYGAYCSMFIYGIDVTDEAQTISVEDLFTENVFQFVARDLTTFKAGNPEVVNNSDSNKNEEQLQAKVNSSRLFMLDTNAASMSDIDEYVREKREKADAILKEDKLREALLNYPFTRTLKLNALRPMIGNDVLKIQESLNRVLREESRVALTGVYDKETEAAVREWQSLSGSEITGKIGIKDYLRLINEANIDEGIKMYSIVINRSGTYAYSEPDSTSSVSYTYPYKENVAVYDRIKGTDGHDYYVTDAGFVRASDMFSSVDKNAVRSFPILKNGMQSVYVIMLKRSLETIYPGIVFDDSSEYTDNVEEAVKRFQKEKELPETGVVDQDMWKMIEAEVGNINISEQNDISFSFSPEGMPGEYAIKERELGAKLDKMAITLESRQRSSNFKYTATTKYHNNKYKTISSIEILSGARTLRMTNFLQSFLYDPENGEPDTVEVTIFSDDADIYKWFFTLES